MTDHEPIPIERTQKIEIALNTYEPRSPNLVGRILKDVLNENTAEGYCGAV